MACALASWTLTDFDGMPSSQDGNAEEDESDEVGAARILCRRHTGLAALAGAGDEARFVEVDQRTHTTVPVK